MTVEDRIMARFRTEYVGELIADVVRVDTGLFMKELRSALLEVKRAYKPRVRRPKLAR